MVKFFRFDEVRIYKSGQTFPPQVHPQSTILLPIGLIDMNYLVLCLVFMLILLVF